MTPPPLIHIPISTRLSQVDIRIWYFLYSVLILFLEGSLVESALRYGIDWNVLIELIAGVTNCFVIYSAVYNGHTSLRIVKVYMIVIFILCSLITLASPVYMYKHFDNHVAVSIRLHLDHGLFYMGFWKSLCYCIYYEINLIFINFCAGLQLWLVDRVQRKIREESEGYVEMEDVI